MRHALRGLLRSPGFSSVVILLLSVGIGANVLIFSFVDTLLLRPLPVRDPEHLVRLQRLRPKNIPDNEFYYIDLGWLRTHSKTLTDLIGSQSIAMSFESAGRAENISALMVTPGHDAVLGIQPALGRLLNESDNSDLSAHSAVLSYSLWQRAYGGRTDILGREIRLRGLPFTIVGVLPRGYNGMAIDEAIDAELPISSMLRWIKNTRYDLAAVQIYARLRPGVSIAEARTEFGVLMPDLLEARIAAEPNVTAESAKSERDREKAHKPWMEEAGGGISAIRTQFGLAVRVLMTAVGLLLLLVCANVGGLLLARNESRRQEIAIRLSLGASRGAVLRLVLGEGLLLATAGLLGALLVARFAAPWLITQLPSKRPLALGFTPDWRVIGFCALVAVLSALAVSLAPAIRAMRVDLTGMMGRGGPRVRRSAAAYAFVAVQVMLATILTIGGALLVRTLDRLIRADVGFTRQQLIVMEVNPRNAGVKSDGQASVMKALLEGARRIPSVESASLAQGRLMQGLGLKRTVGAAGTRVEASEFLNTSTNMVTPEYLDTLRMRLLEGRLFTAADEKADKPKPSVVTRSFARRFFGTEHAVGRLFGAALNSVAQPESVVIGVVEDTKYRSMREDTPPISYELLTPEEITYSDGMALHVRAKGDPAGTIAALRDLLAHTGPGLAAERIATMDEEIDRSLWRERLIASLAAAFALLAAFLAAVGLYGTLSQTVRRRTRELGIRIALGATVARVVRLVTRDIAISVTPGLAIGLAAYFTCARGIVPLLYGVDPFDAGLLIGAISFLLACTAMSGFVPTRRAVTIQPSEALRDQ